jgi:hypothetical protein
MTASKLAGKNWRGARNKPDELRARAKITLKTIETENSCGMNYVIRFYLGFTAIGPPLRVIG